MRSTVPIETIPELDKSLPEYSWPFILVPVTINGKGPFRFVLELKRTITTLTSEFALRIEGELEKRGRSISFTAIENDVTFPLATIPNFAVGSAVVRDFEVLIWKVILDQPHSPSHSKKAAGAEIPWDGILGFDFISQFEMTLNFRRKLLMLGWPIEG